MVPADAVPVIDEVLALTAEHDTLMERSKDVLRRRDDALVRLWDVAGKSSQRPHGLTYGQIERVTKGELRESNVRRIIERKR